MTESALVHLLRLGYALPTEGADFSTAGFLVRVKSRGTTAEELQLLYETLQQSPPVDVSETGLLAAQYLFVSSCVLLTWRWLYRDDSERDRLIGKCVAEMGRVMQEEEVLGRRS